MNGLPGTSESLVSEITDRAVDAVSLPDVVLCPPAPLLSAISGVISEGPLQLGAQDCHASKQGAHTGDVSAQLLKALGCQYVIVGHSERRADHGESNLEIKAKANAALDSGLTPIVCVGETREERDAGRAAEVVDAQVTASLPDNIMQEQIVIAYEPVWAIGTGLTATERDIGLAHTQIRETFSRGYGLSNKLRVLYGGSVKGSNAVSILRISEVNGALVGGASLNAEDFWNIIEACPQ